MTASQARYWLLRKHDICPHCKRDPKPGRVYCEEYIEANTRRNSQGGHLSPERKSYMKRWRERRAHG